MLNASADVIRIVDSPTAAAIAWIKSPQAMPRPVMIPTERPPCAVRVKTSSTAGPGIRNKPRTTAVKDARVASSNIVTPEKWIKELPERCNSLGRGFFLWHMAAAFKNDQLTCGNIPMKIPGIGHHGNHMVIATPHDQGRHLDCLDQCLIIHILCLTQIVAKRASVALA